ncbi:hypothetical protein Tco_1436009, partial [Tanacetum coccineum]
SDGGDQEVAFVGGHGNVEPIVPTTDNIVSETEAYMPKRSKKKRVTRGSESTPAASHPPKRLRADYGKTGGSSAGALPTLPFITSSVTASPLEEGKDHTNSVTSPSLRTVGPSARFVAPVMTAATTITTFVSNAATTTATPVDVGKDKDVPTLSIFAGSSSSDKTDHTLSLFTGRSGSDFVTGSIRARGAANVDLQEIYIPECYLVEFNVSAVRNLSLSSEVRMRAEYNILEKRMWKSLAKEKNNLLQVKDKEIEELRSQLLQAKDESMKVNELETSSAGLREKLETYEGSMKQLEEFQDNLMKPLEARLAEIDADFTRCCMHFQDNFHPHLLNGIAGRRWLLTHGMKLLMAKCLNSTEYMEALGNAFGRAIEKGMQEADFNFAVRDLHGLDFSLLQELSAKKDASTWDVMDLLRLDDVVAKVLGMTDLQPDVGQLMVLVHHKQDKVVIGSQALFVALETCHKRVRKMERNLTERLPFLKDVFVSIDHPLSAEALTILPETSTEPPVKALITTALSTVVIRPNSDPFLLVEDYKNPDLAGAVPEDVISGPKDEGKVRGSTKGDVDVGDLVFSQFENEARDAVL